jgi:hypothetical protein
MEPGAGQAPSDVKKSVVTTPPSRRSRFSSATWSTSPGVGPVRPGEPAADVFYRWQSQLFEKPCRGALDAARALGGNGRGRAAAASFRRPSAARRGGDLLRRVGARRQISSNPTEPPSPRMNSPGQAGSSRWRSWIQPSESGGRADRRTSSARACPRTGPTRPWQPLVGRQADDQRRADGTS